MLLLYKLLYKLLYNIIQAKEKSKDKSWRLGFRPVKIYTLLYYLRKACISIISLVSYQTAFFLCNILGKILHIFNPNAYRNSLLSTAKTLFSKFPLVYLINIIIIRPPYFCQKFYDHSSVAKRLNGFSGVFFTLRKIKSRIYYFCLIFIYMLWYNALWLELCGTES
jgi:hypothetical protein